MLLALGTVAVATGMIDTVVCPTVLALIEAMAVMAALALLDGTDDFTVGGGQVRAALKVCWREGGDENLAQGGHGSSPCMRAVRRSYASSWPLWVRWKEAIVVSSWVCPR
jgi:hypothetical protein